MRSPVTSLRFGVVLPECLVGRRILRSAFIISRMRVVARDQASGKVRQRQVVGVHHRTPHDRRAE